MKSKFYSFSLMLGFICLTLRGHAQIDYTAFDPSKVFIKYESEQFSKPVILGETGYSAIDPAHVQDGCISDSLHPIIGDLADQENFADYSLKYSGWYGFQGYSWWIYKDFPWYGCDKVEALQNYHGLVYLAEHCNNTEVHKPAGEVFINYDYEECDSCFDPPTSFYHNPTFTGQDTVVYSDYVTSTDGPVEDAFIWASLYDTSWNTLDQSFAITDSVGYFKLYTSIDNFDSKYLLIQCSKPGYDIQQETFYSIPPQNNPDFFINLFDPPQPVPEYNTWLIEDGEDITWEASKVPGPNDVVIEPGGVLTVKAPVFFNAGSRLIVQRGGKLIIEAGGRLTSNCSSLWKGVELWGQYNRPQTNAYQGIVEIIGGGIIENAVCGINTIKFGLPEGDESIPQNEYSGGMVLCDDALFKNNNIAVNFWPYTYESSSSLFRSCQFITGNDKLADCDPDYFIVMTDIDGIDFAGCIFRDQQSYTDPDERTSGIESFDAMFSLFLSSSQPNVFSGLYYGIRAHSTAPTNFVQITGTDFIDNYRGLYISGMETPLVENNNFSINSPFSKVNGGYGLYLDCCTGYKVEDNNFYHEDGNPVGVGLVVNQSKEEPNMIRRDYFTNLECGINIQGENRAKDGTGLNLRCNKFNDTEMDIVVTWESPLENPFAGVASAQGSSSSNPEDMAGNLFQIDGQMPNGDFDDILNEANHITYYWPINYNFSYNNVKPVDFTQNTVTLESETILPNEWTYENGCPPDEPGGGGGGIGDTRDKITSAGQKVDSTENLLSLLIDGGNTEATQSEVDNSIPPETMQVYNDLMNKSPYLSDTVLSTAIGKEDVLPDAMIRDIMVANPKAAKSDVLMEKLDERWNPLPEYMKAQILAGRSIVSVREETESRLLAYRLEKAELFHSLVRYYLSDTVNPQASLDSLAFLLQNEHNLNAKYKLAVLQGEQEAWAEGLAVLNNIPAQFILTPLETQAYSQFTLYCTILSGLAQQGKSVFDADSTQIATLVEMEANKIGKASVYARNILLALGQMDYEEPIIFPDLLKSTTAMGEYKKLSYLANDAPGYIKVQPNPAKEYIIIEYELERETDITLEINDISGILKFSKATTGKQDQFLIDTRHWNAGIYAASLKINGKLIESVKFTVID